jgi:pimeloyl-ACP methyl ester carboxylesterase
MGGFFLLVLTERYGNHFEIFCPEVEIFGPSPCAKLVPMNNARKTLVAIHGAGMNAAVWGGITPHLLDYGLRAFSLPGHDPKAGGALIPDIAGMAAWVRQRLEGALPGSVVLMGHSMGALVALAAASDPCVAGLVLLGSAARMPVNPELLKTAREQPAEAIGLIIKWGVDPAHPQVGAVRTVLGSLMHGIDPKAVGNDLAACDAFKDGEELAKKIPLPALVVSGQHDKMAKASEGEKLAGLLPRAHFHLLPDSGHMMMVERPIETAHEIKDFIGNLAREEVA